MCGLGRLDRDDVSCQRPGLHVAHLLIVVRSGRMLVDAHEAVGTGTVSQSLSQHELVSVTAVQTGRHHQQDGPAGGTMRTNDLRHVQGVAFERQRNNALSDVLLRPPFRSGSHVPDAALRRQRVMAPGTSSRSIRKGSSTGKAWVAVKCHAEHVPNGWDRSRDRIVAGAGGSAATAIAVQNKMALPARANGANCLNREVTAAFG